MKILLIIVFSISVFTSFGVKANNAVSEQKTWQKPTPMFDQKYDWLRLTSDEWLKGDIISMYDDVLEFDSEKFDRLTFDWDDVAELRSRFDQRIRLANGSVLEGFLIVKDGKVTILSDGKAHDFSLSELLSITSSSESRRNLWDGNLNLGLNFLKGNVGQRDITTTGKIERRTPETRFRSDLFYNYSKVENKADGTNSVKANSLRITSYFDWFYNPKIFFRLLDFEHFSDALQNINSRNTYGSAFGYHITDDKRTLWDVTLGPSYQTSSFENSIENEPETSAVVSLGTLFEHEISSDIDIVVDYQLQFVNDKSGRRIHNLKTGFSFDLAYDIDLDFYLYIDRTANPIVDENGDLPEKNDYRLVMSLGYDF